MAPLTNLLLKNALFPAAEISASAYWGYVTKGVFKLKYNVQVWVLSASDKSFSSRHETAGHFRPKWNVVDLSIDQP